MIYFFLFKTKNKKRKTGLLGFKPKKSDFVHEFFVRFSFCSFLVLKQKTVRQKSKVLKLKKVLNKYL